jgi:nucleotide-binding universal stress UspA family protein
MRDLGWPLEEDQLALVPDRSPARGLLRAAADRNAVLTTLGRSQRSGLGRVFPGTAERLLAGASSPVAIAPNGYADATRALETIGVAFDGSEESRAALAWAKELARGGGSSLRIITVHRPLVWPTPAFQSAPMLAQEDTVKSYVARRLHEAVRDAEREGVEAQALLRTGHAESHLVAESERVDLMVAGSRGLGRVRTLLAGTVSDALSRDAASPLVLIPRGAASAYTANDALAVGDVRSAVS